MKLLAFLFCVGMAQAWGQPANGLRIGLSVNPSNLSPTVAEFSIALENAGDADVVLNLGQMLANGKVMWPTAVRLRLTDPAGKTRELEFFDRRHPAIRGRMDDFTVALRARSTYILRTSLRQYHAGNDLDVKLVSGRNRITARFEGRGAQTTNLDMPGVALLNFWKGTVQSNVVEFDVPPLSRSRR